MSRRYGERGYERYGDEEDARDYEARERREDESYGGRHIRGLGYGGESARARDYDYGRDYGYGRDYSSRDSLPRDYGSRDYGPREYGAREYGSRDYNAREYGRRVGYEGEDYAAERGRDYGRAQGRDYERERGREHDPNRVRSFDTDYGRTTSRFYGRSGYEFGRDDYDRPNYGPEVTEYYARRRDEHGRGRDERDERDERYGRHERGREGRGWWDRAADEVLSWFGDEEAARRRRAEGGREVGNRDRERGEGLYRGRGPKNYRRPDERIREEINDRLTDNDWLDASDVEVTVASGEVALSGTVDSRYSKRLAEDIAESVAGVRNVQNNLRVQNYQTGSPAAAPQQSTLMPPFAGDETVTAGDVTMADRTAAPSMTDVIKNAVTNASTTPDVQGSAGADATTTTTRASKAGGLG